METAVAAALAAMKEAALAASTAAAAAATAKEAAVAASAAALAPSFAATAAVKAAATSMEAAVAASATALYAKEAVDVAVAALQAANGGGNIDDGDLMSRLPDDILGSIISLLPTKEGVRTQAICRRWRLLWRSAPLNLVVDNKLTSKDCNTADLVTKILAEHLGPARRFLLSNYMWHCYYKIEHWLSSQALDNLHELELNYDPCYGDRGNQRYRLSSTTYRFAPTLRLARFSGFHFADSIVQLSLKFPCLKQLTLESITISEDALHSFLSGCPVLESLELKNNFGFGRLRIRSQTLRSIGFCAALRKESVILQELVVEDAPCLERLLPLDPQFGPATIRLISAPKLKILGVLSKDLTELHFGTMVFQKMIAVTLTTKIHSVRVLALDPSGPNLDTVVGFLKCFPCLEKLYVIFGSGIGMDNVRKYELLDSIECLDLHLKKVVLKNYDGTIRPSIDFAKFFILNAKVLKEMKITLPCHRQHNWFAKQHRLLRIENSASRDARIELTCGVRDEFTHNMHTHDLLIADPFDKPSTGCFSCH